MNPMSQPAPRGIGRAARLVRQAPLARIIVSAVLVLTGFALATAPHAVAADTTPTLAYPQVTPGPTATPGNGCSETPQAGDLRARITDHAGSTTALFTNRSASCSYQIGLATYKKVDENIDHQQLYDNTAATIAPNSTLELSVSNPPCAYQADAFWGVVISSFAGGQRYGQRRLADSDGGTDYCGTVQPSATPSPTDTPLATPTLVPPTETATPVPPTETAIPTVRPPRNTPVPPTETAVPPTETAVPPVVPPTATPVPPTETAVSPTETAVPPTATPVPPASTALPTDTPQPPVIIVVPTDTPVPPTLTVRPTQPPAPPQAIVVPPTVSPSQPKPAATRQALVPPAAAPAPGSRALPLIGTDAGPETLPPTGGTADLALGLALVFGVMLSMAGGLLRRRASLHC